MLEILLQAFYVALSIVLLWKGSDWLVDSSVRIGRKVGLSELTTGLVIVSMATSAPEFAVTATAALQGQDNISVGNIVGSNIFNLGIILGSCAIISALATNRALVFRDGGILIGTTLLLTFMLSDNHLSRLEGGVLFAGLIAYVFMLVMGKQQIDDDLPTDEATWRDGMLLAGGILGVVGGGQLLVIGSSELARMAGVSDWVIAVTIVAAGTSTPELATSLNAALKGRSGLSVGNLIGSDIFNMLGVLGVAGLMKPLTISAEAMPSIYMLVGMCTMTVFFMRTGWRLGRIEGGILVTVALLRWGLDLGT